MLYDFRPIKASKQIKILKAPTTKQEKPKKIEKQTKNFSETYLLMCKVMNISQSFIKLANVYCSFNFHNRIIITISDHLQMNISVLRI